MKSDDVMHNIFGNKNSGIGVSEGTKINSFSIVAKLSKSALSAELENINLLAPKFYFAHPVYKMQKYRTKKR
jgi:hypothetical protein